jgi:receptor-type tyrosine-protein phosphatase Q
MFSFLVPSAPPTDLSAITPNATTLDITWQPPGLAHQNGIIRGYVLTVFSIEGGTSQQLNSNESHLVIYNLHPFYTYSFHIAAVTVGPGPFSEIFSIQMPPTAPTSPPLNISVTVVSSVAISVTWDPPLVHNQNGIIISYIIQLYDIVTGQTTLYEREGHHSQLVIDTLHPYYVYAVSMAAETVDLGPFSTSQSIQTFQDIPSASPQNLTGFANGSRCIILIWLPPPVDTRNGVIQRYTISIFVTETRESLVLFSEGAQLVFDIAHPYYTYTFAVAAETIGAGPYGAELTITTPEDVPTAAPQFFEAVAVSSGSIRMTWIPPPEEEQNGVIRSYHIYVTELLTEIVQEILTEGNARIQIVNHLHPYYTYKCEIAAFTITLGPTASTQTTTHPAVPSDVPLNVAAESLNATHAMLAWDPPPPEHQNGLIELYIIHITVTDTGKELQHMSVYNSTVIGPLHPFYTYKFSIAAQTVAVGPFTTPVAVKMPEAAPSGVPHNVSIYINTSSSVYVSWLPPDIQFWNGVITNYTIVYVNLGVVQGKIDGDNVDQMPIVTSTASIPQPGQTLVNSRNPTFVVLPLRQEGVFIDQLEEYHLYSFAVHQTNIKGTGPSSEAIIEDMPQGAPSGSPTGVIIEALSSTSVLIKWGPPEIHLRNGVITKYNLSIVFASNNTFQSYSVPAAVLAFPIEGVQKFSKVSVSIAAETIVGIGPFSDIVFAVTLEDVPLKVGEPVLTVLNETAVRLVWSPPDNPNGIIIEYQVIYYGLITLTETQKKQVRVVNIPAKEENNSLTIADLVPGQNYEFKLRARTNTGYGANVTLDLTLPVTVHEGTEQISGQTSGIAAAFIIVVVVVVVVACGIFYWRRRQRRLSQRNGTNASPGQEMQTTFQNISPYCDIDFQEADDSKKVDIDETKIDD